MVSRVKWFSNSFQIDINFLLYLNVKSISYTIINDLLPDVGNLLSQHPELIRLYGLQQVLISAMTSYSHSASFPPDFIFYLKKNRVIKVENNVSLFLGTAICSCFFYRFHYHRQGCLASRTGFRGSEELVD